MLWAIDIRHAEYIRVISISITSMNSRSSNYSIRWPQENFINFSVNVQPIPLGEPSHISCNSSSVVADLKWNTSYNISVTKHSCSQ